jgi:predicted secreted Zn-dependent protease
VKLDLGGIDTSRLTWRTSTFCSSGACVEVAPTAECILLRDSKDPAGPVLAFSHDEWAAFVSGVHAREFDFD